MANIAEMVKELQQERDRLNHAIAALAPLAGGHKTSAIQGGTTRPRRTLSAAARRRISIAQKARWAKARGSKAPAPVRMMSRAARNKIAAAQRARWAKTRAQQKKAA
jgi:hypothetical protein